MREPLISVVVPFFNSALHLDACIRSLLAQDCNAPFEIILIDNGARDASPAIAARYADAVELLREPTPGAYAARNAGIRRARGRLLAFTDADCVADRGWLRAIQRGMAEPEVAILLGHCRYPAHSSLALRLLAEYENAKTRFVLRQLPAEHRFGYANNMAIRASVFAELGLFKEWKRAGDSEIIHRLAAARPELQTRFCAAMRVTHREFSSALQRLRRLLLYRTTNSRIGSFRELDLGGRARLLLGLAWEALRDGGR